MRISHRKPGGRPLSPGAVRWVVGPCLALVALAGSPAEAGLDFYRLFKTEAYSQTSNAAPTTPSGFFADFDLVNHDPADPTAGTVANTLTNQMFTLANAAAGLAIYQQSFPSLAAMDAVFANSTTYRYASTTGSTAGQAGSLTTPASDLFAAQVPAFTGTTYGQLQGINAASAFTFNFTTFTPAAGINDALVFYSLTDTTTNQVVVSGSGSNTLGSFSIGANTLIAGHTYDVGVDFSSRIDTPNAGFNGATSTVAFDQRVDLAFTTAAATVPEPASLTLSGVGMVIGLALVIWRRSRVWRAPLATS